MLPALLWFFRCGKCKFHCGALSSACNFCYLHLVDYECHYVLYPWIAIFQTNKRVEWDQFALRFLFSCSQILEVFTPYVLDSRFLFFFYTAFLPYWHNLVGNAVLYDQTSPNASFWHAIADYWINSAINRWPACNQLCIKIETEKFFYMHLVINNLEFTGTGYVHVVNSECSVYLFFLVFFLSISPFKYSDTILYR